MHYSFYVVEGDIVTFITNKNLFSRIPYPALLSEESKGILQDQFSCYYAAEGTTLVSNNTTKQKAIEMRESTLNEVPFAQIKLTEKMQYHHHRRVETWENTSKLFFLKKKI